MCLIVVRFSSHPRQPLFFCPLPSLILTHRQSTDPVSLLEFGSAFIYKTLALLEASRPHLPSLFIERWALLAAGFVLRSCERLVHLFKIPRRHRRMFYSKLGDMYADSPTVSGPLCVA